MFRPPRAIQIETTGNESPATMFTGSIKDMQKYSVYNARRRLFFLSVISSPKPEASNSHITPLSRCFRGLVYV